MRIINLFFITLIISISFSSNIFASKEKFMYNSHNKRDPFISLVIFDKEQAYDREKDEEISDYEYVIITLEGIVYDSVNGSRVIIDGQILKVGDELGNFKVEQIFRDRIIVNLSGEMKVIKLREEEEAFKENEEKKN